MAWTARLAVRSMEDRRHIRASENHRCDHVDIGELCRHVRGSNTCCSIRLGCGDWASWLCRCICMNTCNCFLDRQILASMLDRCIRACIHVCTPYTQAAELCTHLHGAVHRPAGLDDCTLLGGRSTVSRGEEGTQARTTWAWSWCLSLKTSWCCCSDLT